LVAEKNLTKNHRGKVVISILFHVTVFCSQFYIYFCCHFLLFNFLKPDTLLNKKISFYVTGATRGPVLSIDRIILSLAISPRLFTTPCHPPHPTPHNLASGRRGRGGLKLDKCCFSASVHPPPNPRTSSRGLGREWARTFLINKGSTKEKNQGRRGQQLTGRSFTQAHRGHGVQF
jgi:hypothetical protein